MAKRIYDRDQIVKLRAEGKTYREISKELGCSSDTIKRALRENGCIRPVFEEWFEEEWEKATARVMKGMRLA